MSDIITRCPQCQTAFRVTENQLIIAKGAVRCGSCLSVFKAADHQVAAKPANPPKRANTAEIGHQKQEKPQPNQPQEPAIRQATDKQDDDTAVAGTPTTQQANSEKPDTQDKKAAEAEELIDDSNNDREALDFGEAIYDLDANKQTQAKNISLFDLPKNKTIPKQARESADESWALDMLAELEDTDEITPLSVKTRTEKNPDKAANTQNTAPAPNADTSPAATPSAAGAAPSAHKKHHKEEPSAYEGNASAYEGNISAHEEEPSAYEAKVSAYEAKVSAYGDEVSAHEAKVSAHEDEVSTYKDEISDHKNAPSANKQTAITAIAADDDLLDFDPDLRAPLSATEDQRLDTHTADENTPHHISEAAIENAMHTRTRYVDEQRDYLAAIEPDPVEMAWHDNSGKQRWLWRLGALIAAALILLQLAVFRFDTLAKHPRYRPYYAQACALLHCQLPSLVDTAKIRTTNLVVRSHPREKQALIADAILINAASFQQAYPVLRLEFSDLSNQIVAARNLQPQDYLRGELAGTTHMPPNQPIQVSLEIVDPGDSAINYQLNVIR
ncbi:MAG: DUF3426 domain-containing protein [Cellvibrionaceae bacterium]|nr:DUF3426 domain-containing protein [Cellvibrionaceae bacterium]